MIPTLRKIPGAFVSEEERAAVKAEQIRAFFDETNDQNLAGAIVLSLIVYVVHDGIPAWTWLPALAAVYAITLARTLLIRQFHRDPSRRSTAQWGRGQTIAIGLAGAGWGLANTAMLAHVSTEFQLFILTVMTVVAATSSTEGFAYPPPSRAFVLLSLGPAILWLMTVGDRMHYILAGMLMVFVPLTLWQAQKRNLGFIEALQLRFRNEALAREVAAQRDAAEQEIAERKRAEQALAESEERYRAAFVTSPDPVLISLMTDGRLLDVNDGFVRMTAWTKEEAIGRTALELHIWRNPADRLRLVEGLRSKGHVDDLEAEFLAKDRRVITGLMSARVMAIKGEQCLLSVIKDITERKEAEEERRKLDQLKNDFLSTVSHELRTPMTSVVGFAILVKKKLEEVVFPKVASDEKTNRAISQVRGNIDIIVKESERLTLLINDVLDSAKLEAGKVAWQFAPLPPAQMIGKAVAVTAPLAAQKGLRLTWRVAPDLPEVMADAGRIQQVLINLVSNAIKFTPRGEIALDALHLGDFVRFRVRDSGIGIPGEHLDDVFSKFRQISDTLTDKPQGTGLGLSICRQIIESHGGRIRAESSLGQGSVFSFDLPVAISKTAPMSGEATIS